MDTGGKGVASIAIVCSSNCCFDVIFMFSRVFSYCAGIRKSLNVSDAATPPSRARAGVDRSSTGGLENGSCGRSQRSRAPPVSAVQRDSVEVGQRVKSRRSAEPPNGQSHERSATRHSLDTAPRRKASAEWDDCKLASTDRQSVACSAFTTVLDGFQFGVTKTRTSDAAYLTCDFFSAVCVSWITGWYWPDAVDQGVFYEKSEELK